MEQLDSQEKIILAHFARNKSITSMDAFNLYGITRLSARILELREKGYDILTQYEEAPNRFGKMVRYGRYFLIKSPRKTLHLWK